MVTRNRTALPAHLTPDNHSQFQLESSSRWNEDVELESLLSPTDGGKEALSFLAVAFVIEVLVWGSSPSPSPIHLFTFASLIRWPQYKRTAIVARLLIMCLSLSLSSLCSTVSNSSAPRASSMTSVKLWRTVPSSRSWMNGSLKGKLWRLASCGLERG
jgi:hypothetical protein